MKQSISKQLAISSTQIVQSEILLAIPAKDLDDEELIAVWSVMDIMQKSMADIRKEEIREEMFERATKKGKKNDKGSFEWKLQDGKITKQCRQKKPMIEPTLVKLKLGNNDFVGQAFRYAVSFTGKERLALEEILNQSEHSMARYFFDKLEESVESVDESAFNGLVSAGLISEKEAKKVTITPDPTWSLSVIKPKDLKKVQKDIKATLSDREE